jgi:hypothetical protein
MRLLEVAGVASYAADEFRASDRGTGPIFHVAEQSLGELENLVCVDLAACGEDQSGWDKLAAHPLGAIVSSNLTQARFAAEHGPSKRLVGKGRFEEVLMDEVIRRIDGLADFRKYDLFLPLQMGLVEVRIAYEIGDQLGEQGRITRENAAMECRLVA